MGKPKEATLYLLQVENGRSDSLIEVLVIVKCRYDTDFVLLSRGKTFWAVCKSEQKMYCDCLLLMFAVVSTIDYLFD